MRIRVLETLKAPFPENTADCQVVVIDVLRATSCMVTALAGGATEIIPCLTPQEALDTAVAFPPGSFLLGGERAARPLPGFDVGNSPLEYAPDKVRGKRIISTTTNGTIAIRSAIASGADNVFLGSFLNSSAVAAVLKRAEEVIILCAGTLGNFSLDDFAVAGRLVALLAADHDSPSLNDAAATALVLYRHHEDRLAHLLSSSVHGQAMVKAGMEQDIEHCAQVDIFAVVPQWHGEGFRQFTPADLPEIYSTRQTQILPANVE